jgi:hypothetical protein
MSDTPRLEIHNRYVHYERLMLLLSKPGSTVGCGIDRRTPLVVAWMQGRQQALAARRDSYASHERWFMHALDIKSRRVLLDGREEEMERRRQYTWCEHSAEHDPLGVQRDRAERIRRAEWDWTHSARRMRNKQRQLSSCGVVSVSLTHEYSEPVFPDVEIWCPADEVVSWMPVQLRVTTFVQWLDSQPHDGRWSEVSILLLWMSSAERAQEAAEDGFQEYTQWITYNMQQKFTRPFIVVGQPVLTRVRKNSDMSRVDGMVEIFGTDELFPLQEHSSDVFPPLLPPRDPHGDACPCV